jgi:tetratricopeptide (TPR) repeat protein
VDLPEARRIWCWPRRAAEIAPDNFTAIFNLGSAYLRAAQYPEGLRVFQKALEIAPAEKQVDALSHVGLAFEMIGNFDQAVAYYDRAITLRPDDKELYQSRALAILETGQACEGHV